jgi:hypothetical protein
MAKVSYELEHGIPLPERRTRESEVTPLLDMLSVGDSLKIPRGRKAMEMYVYRYRIKRGRQLRFKVGALRSDVSRVWRVA